MPTEVDEDLIEVSGWLFGSEANQQLARRECALPLFQLLGDSYFACIILISSPQHAMVRSGLLTLQSVI